MKQVSRKHPLAIRWFHWLNFPLLALMIWSGVMILWANNVYEPLGLTHAGNTPVQMIPNSLLQKFGWTHRLAEGMSWHFTLAWLFTINGILYVGYTIISGEWRFLLPGRHSFRDAMLVTLHDLHLRKSQPPIVKYNGAQRIAYSLVVLMGVGSVGTGLAIYKPTQLAWLNSLLGGYQWARWQHHWLMIGYLAFFLIHIAQVIRAGWNNFRSMISGVEVIETREAPHGNG